MAVEAVAHILPVRYIFNDPVFLPKLVHLHAAEVLSRSSVDGIEMPVLLLELRHPVIDILQGLQCKRTVFGKRFFIIKLLQFIQCRDPEGCGG